MSRLLAKTSKTGKSKVVATITQGKAKRTNTPTAEYQAVMAEEDRIGYSSLRPWLGDLVCAKGSYVEGTSDSGPQRRAGVFIGPEFGTVFRPDLVQAAREAADAGFDVLIACAFNYDAHASEFNKLGRIPILKARMNADLHMADDCKNTGKAEINQEAWETLQSDTPGRFPDQPLAASPSKSPTTWKMR